MNLGMQIEIIALIIFILLMCILLYGHRKKITIQKIFFPLLYIIMYKSKFGLKFTEKISTKYRELVKLFGYIAIGVGFLGMAVISISIIAFVLRLIFQPELQEAGVALVLPFTNIPGIGYLSFSHWIIAIFILAVIHEFAHGVVARAHKIEIKSSGFAFLSAILPIIPAAFVEPNEKKLKKQSSAVQYSVFAAGPMANLVLALVIVLAFPFVASQQLAPFEDKITEPIGFSFTAIDNNTYPIKSAGIESGVLDSFNGKEMTNYEEFAMAMYCVKPAQELKLGINGTIYALTTVQSPYKEDKGFVGLMPKQNERRVKEGYSVLAVVFYWFKGLIKWLFLLNFFIGLANLLPLGIVDGGRMLHVALHDTITDKKKAHKIWVWIAILFLGFIVLGLLSNYFGNPFLFFR